MRWSRRGKVPLGKCPLRHMIDCIKLVLCPHCPHSCACSGNVWLVCPLKILLTSTSLHPFVSDGVPVLTDHVMPPSFASPPSAVPPSFAPRTFMAAATSCSKPFLEYLLPFRVFVTVSVTGGADFQHAQKHVFKTRRQDFQNTLLQSKPLCLLDKTAPAFFTGSGAAGFPNTHVHFLQSMRFQEGDKILR